MSRMQEQKNSAELKSTIKEQKEKFQIFTYLYRKTCFLLELLYYKIIYKY